MVSEGSLRAEGVGYRYGGNPVLCDVTLELRTGEMLALAGPNGSGKTTFLRILSGILPPLTGGVTLDGVDLRRTDYDHHATAAFFRATDLPQIEEDVRHVLTPISREEATTYAEERVFAG